MYEYYVLERYLPKSSYYNFYKFSHKLKIQRKLYNHDNYLYTVFWPTNNKMRKIVS